MRRGPVVLRLLVAAIVLFAAWSGDAFAQGLQKPIHNYMFAHFEENAITFPSGDSTGFVRFFRKLDTLLFFGEGDVNIVHIGGSHVQSGTFPNRMRRNLLAMRYGIEGGRGVVFPFSVAKSNTPSSYYSSYTGKWKAYRNSQPKTPLRMGLTGMAASTSDPSATVTIVSRERNPMGSPYDFRFDRVQVLGRSDSDTLVPVVHLDTLTLLPASHDPDRDLYEFVLPSLTDSLVLGTSGVPGEWNLTGIVLDHGRPGLTYHGIGVNGASLNSYFKCEDFERDLALLKPDLIIFAIGINDANTPNFNKERFVSNYIQMVDMALRVAPDCAILFVTNNDSFRRSRRSYYLNQNGPVVQDAFYGLARRYDAGIWDLFRIMGGLNSMKQWESAGLANRDKIHFTESGYILIGDLLYNALLDRYLEHLKSTSSKNDSSR